MFGPWNFYFVHNMVDWFLGYLYMGRFFQQNEYEDVLKNEYENVLKEMFLGNLLSLNC
jgi:hypothetical protein